MGSRISSTGTGADAATITIEGIGGSGLGRNYGVHLGGSFLDVTSVKGSISITGQGGNGSDGSNYGVFLVNLETISSTGIGADSATITIDGTGGDGRFGNGVVLAGSTTDVTSVDGAISITGQGDNESGIAVLIHFGATVQVTTGILTVSGTAVADNSNGVRLAGGRLVSIGSGVIQVTAEGNGTEPDFEAVDDANAVNSIIGGPSATGAITLNADSVTLGGTTNVQSTGTLTIQPRTASTTSGIGGGTGDLNLSDTEIGLLADGFSLITIGDALAGVGNVDIDTATFTDPVIIAGGVIHDNLGTDINAGTNTVTLIGTVAPGESPGILVVNGNFAFADNDTFDVEIGGTTPGNTTTDHDQIDVTGTVTIGTGVMLNTSNFDGFTPSDGQYYVIINNDGNDAVSGTFAGLPEGALITNFLGSDLSARISYLGIDAATGNDVVLEVVVANQPPFVVNLIDDVAANEDGPDDVIDLSNVFDDVDAGDTLTLTVTGNTNPTLLNASILGTNLTLDYLVDQSGTADITIRATDSGGLFVEDIFTVTVLSAQEQNEEIIQVVQDLVATNDLSGGQGNSLITKLDGAIAKLDQDNTTSGVNQLNASINQINAFIKKGSLSTSDGQALIDAINDVIQSASETSGAGLVEAASQTSASSDGAPVTRADELVTGAIGVFFDDANVTTADLQARFLDSIDMLNVVFGPYGVSLIEVAAAADAVLVVEIAASSEGGSAADGLLGYSVAGHITLLSGWNWYAGADPLLIGSDQYDLQTIMTHELGHSTGLAHSGDADSVMYEMLGMGEIHRSITVSDLTLLEAEAASMPQALLAAPRGDDQISRVGIAHHGSTVDSQLLVGSAHPSAPASASNQRGGSPLQSFGF